MEHDAKMPTVWAKRPDCRRFTNEWIGVDTIMGNVLSDIEIAQKTKLEPIVKIAGKVGLTEDDLELYGKYKAKISF